MCCRISVFCLWTVQCPIMSGSFRTLAAQNLKGQVKCLDVVEMLAQSLVQWKFRWWRKRLRPNGQGWEDLPGFVLKWKWCLDITMICWCTQICIAIRIWRGVMGRRWFLWSEKSSRGTLYTSTMMWRTKMGGALTQFRGASTHYVMLMIPGTTKGIELRRLCDTWMQDRMRPTFYKLCLYRGFETWNYGK